MQLISLALATEHTQPLSLLLQQEWGAWAQWAEPTQTAARLTQRSRNATGEQVWLALDESEQALLGTASIIAYELNDQPQRPWWIGEIFTHPEARGQGVASALIRGLVEHFQTQHPDQTLYLYTPDQQALYARKGWLPIEERFLNQEWVTIMGLPPRQVKTA
ncbi:GNAT family N-acetyltransferase [Neisseriaceae bacterium CLB008]